jgi:pimeloyl-ACP methyl ester carboxylesterase
MVRQLEFFPRRGGPPRLGGWSFRLLVLAGLAALPVGEAARAQLRPARGPAGATDSAPSVLAYEVLSPPAPPAGARLPLAVWLHPSAEPMLEKATSDYWPLLRQRNCLMVLPRSRSRRMWLAGEEQGILNVLGEVQIRYPADQKRILLMGVSGGGQVALVLADRWPEKFRAVVVVSASPVVARGDKSDWFYPDRRTLGACPYFVVNHITQGSYLLYWRQVQAKLAPAGASISILPVTGPAGEYLPPPKQLGPWLDDVLAGRHPAPLEDPQKLAVAKMFAPAVSALPGAIDKAVAAGGQVLSREGPLFRLSLVAPFDFQPTKDEDRTDSSGGPITQIRLEHTKWPIVLRAEARSTEKPMEEVLADEEAQNIARGMLYQVYHRGQVQAGGRTWQYRIGSMTYPDRRRGWVSPLFVHSAALIEKDPRRWLTVMLTDRTQQPDANELAAVFKAAIGSLSARPAASAPAGPTTGKSH